MQALLRILTALLALAAVPSQGADSVAFVVIAHSNVARVDAPTLQRLYTGRAIEVGGLPVTVVNASVGMPLRERFLADVVGLDSDRYIAYWTVRRHVGKGVPPRDLKSAAEIIDFVQATPGGLGYIATGDLRPGLNVVFRP
jgi:hypothetical protein